MTVITISRELGSGGTNITRNIAQRLACQVIDKDLIEVVMKQYGMIDFETLYQTTTSIWARFDSENRQIVQMLNKTILAFASRENSIILGRGGFAILQGYANVLNVRIQAPLPMRVLQVMETQQINSYETAEEVVKENDRTRSAFIETFYHVKWDDSCNFDLVLDTSRISPVMAVDWICAAAREVDQHRVTRGKTTREIEVDPILSHAIDDALKAAP